MAQNQQLARLTNSGSDRPFTNTSGTQINAKAAVILDGSTYRGVTGVALGGAGSVADYVGVAAENIPSLKSGRVQCDGEAVMVASGTIAIGDWVTVDVANGKEGRALTDNSADAKQIVGKALSAAADGNDVAVMLMGPAKNN